MDEREGLASIHFLTRLGGLNWRRHDETTFDAITPDGWRYLVMRAGLPAYWTEREDWAAIRERSRPWTLAHIRPSKHLGMSASLSGAKLKCELDRQRLRR
jgi:hypothetical protein